MKIYLDPGHGGTDPGAQANGLEEKNITLAIALKIREMMKKDYPLLAIKMSRTKDETVSLSERTREANAWGADFYLSIHVNAGGGTGYEDYIYQTLASNSKTAQIRDHMHEEIIKQVKIKNRGKKKANFHVLRETKMPALLTENGFIDNKADAVKLRDPRWINAVAEGHVKGLVKAFNLEKQTGKQKYLEIITSTLWTYNTPDWDDLAVQVTRGEVFTVKQDKFPVGRGEMYQIKSGLYITAYPGYVRAYTK